ncbi:MAG: hypothetical protein WC781_03285 [Candidatus Pacearchaeota archaeon]|jgi:hypothetical protein
MKKTLVSQNYALIKKRYIGSSVFFVLFYFIVGLYYKNPNLLIFSVIAGIISFLYYQKIKDNNSYWDFFNSIGPETKKQYYLSSLGIILGLIILVELFGFLRKLVYGKPFNPFLLIPFFVIGIVLFIFIWIRKPVIKKNKSITKDYISWTIILAVIIIFIGIFFIETKIIYFYISLILAAIILIFNLVRIWKDRFNLISAIRN